MFTAGFWCSSGKTSFSAPKKARLVAAERIRPSLLNRLIKKGFYINS
jgi:hypothetical protein